jgi:hypothetical protein
MDDLDVGEGLPAGGQSESWGGTATKYPHSVFESVTSITTCGDGSVHINYWPNWAIPSGPDAGVDFPQPASAAAPMVDRKPDISDLAGEFPKSVNSPARTSSAEADDHRWYRFAHIIQELREKDDKSTLQAAFHRLEQFLIGESPDLRNWATGFLQALQEVCSWSAQDGEAFQGFMGERTRRVWATLDTIRVDLADCSILEAEVLMWRVVHPTKPVERS